MNLSDRNGNSAASAEDHQTAEEAKTEREKQQEAEREAGLAKMVAKTVGEVVEDISQRRIARKVRYARQRGVADAWKMERQAVMNGYPGSRDWTPEQLKELIENGKVDGFVGDHINTVNGNIEKAADHRNIQFLTDAEHHTRHAEMGGTRVPISGLEGIDRTQNGKLPDLATPTAKAWPDTAAKLGLTVMSGAVVTLEMLDYGDPVFGPIGILNPSPAY